MAKMKKVLLMLLKGGNSQGEVAAVLHVSKRDVSEAAKAIREHNLTYEEILGMDPAAVEDKLFPKGSRGRKKNDAYLQPDMGLYVERKKKRHKLLVKQFWQEYCSAALAQGKLAYSYQSFCEQFSAEAERLGATRHFRHTPGEKAYIDWAGDVAKLTDKITGRTTRVYVLVVVLPFSGLFWAHGFTDMRQQSWLEGHMAAFEMFGGVPRMLVPDNCATATDRGSTYETLINKDYERFAEHYGTAVVPARVRRPRDKSTAEGTVNLVEEWIVAPSSEMRFYTLEEFNEFCDEHMPPNHRDVGSPWSRERFTSWAAKIGPETEATIARVLDSRRIVEQAFVPCRNILGLSKRYAPQLLEAACAQVNALGALPSYTGVKNALLSIKADTERKQAARASAASSAASDEQLVDRAAHAGRLRGADAYRRREGRDAD